MQRFFHLAACVALTFVAIVKMPVGAQSDDPFLWLEKKDGVRAMAWVREQNAKTLAVLQADPHYAAFETHALAIAQNKNRIPYPAMRGGMAYNLWQDATHVQGIWRRTSMRSYSTARPAWTTVLDLDALSKAEHKRWVWEGVTCEPLAEQRCILQLSNGGEDAQTLREFDLATDRFVPNGFLLPREKQWVSWLDPNTLLVARAWQPGQLTTSGYPYVIKRLRRGEPLSSAVEVFRGKRTDTGVGSTRYTDGAGNSVTIIGRSIDFFHDVSYVLTAHGLKRIDLPLKSDVDGLVGGKLLVTLREPFAKHGVTYPEGSLIALNLRDVESRPADSHPTLVYKPGPRETLDGLDITKSAAILMTYRERTRPRARVYADGPRLEARRASASGQLLDRTFAKLAEDRRFLYLRDELLAADAAVCRQRAYREDFARKGIAAAIRRLERRRRPARSDLEGRHAAFRTSSFTRRTCGSTETIPTLLYAYGGFGVSQTPFYSGIIGKLWLERGGVFVLANIRGGGEFGPAWHDAGLKTHRQRIYDDFAAVARDLIATQNHEPAPPGHPGRLERRPADGRRVHAASRAWHAVDIEVPLLDMLRYEQIEAGASWIGEYGSVSDPAQRAFLAHRSRRTTI